MREITSQKEIKQILLNILKDFASFCDEQNLKYYLAFGTLLGAVRHNGFIPWDDDLDIMMPRHDYEKFIDTYKSNFYKCIHIDNNNSYFYPFAKVYDTRTIIKEDIIASTEFGLYIDIFPIDGIADGNSKIQLFPSVILQKCMRNKYSSLSRKRSRIKQTFIHITKFLLKPFSLRFLGKEINKLAKKYSYVECNKVAVSVWGYDYQVYYKIMLGNGRKIQFEDGYYNAPDDWDAVLKLIYGDYMMLPPESKRVSVHEFRAYYV